MLLDFERFYQACNPSRPLMMGNLRDRRYYIDFASVRGGKIIEALQRTITRISPDIPTCQLFTGHLGCGKSTELLRLQAELEEQKFHVVYFESTHVLEMADVDVTDILLAIAGQVSESLEAIKIRIKPSYFAKLFTQVTDLMQTPIDLESEGELSVGIAKITAKTKESPQLRRRLRDYLDPRTENILQSINKELLDRANSELKARGKKGLVVIVDNLDRVAIRPLPSGRSLPEYLFIQRGEQLRKLNCHVVYTIPLALTFSNDSAELQQRLGGGVAPKVLPMIPVRSRTGEVYTPGLTLMRQMVLARAFPDIHAQERLNLITEMFDSQETLDRLCLISGGHVRDLLGLLYDCLREQDPPFDRDCVELVIQRQRDYRANAIDPHEWELIFQVVQQQRVRGDIEYHTLLRSLFVFEYRDHQGVWFAVNPVLAETKKFRSFLNSQRVVVGGNSNIYTETARTNQRCNVLITTPQKTVSVGEEIEISVNLNQAEITKSETYTLQISHNDAIGSELNVILNAPRFQLNSDNTASLPLDPDTAQETQTAHFRLTAIRPGNATINVELYRGDTFETKLETQIQVTDIDEAAFTPQRITTQPRPVPQPDFILRIQTIWNETNSTYKFQYQLKSFRFTSVFTENNIYTSDSLSTNWLEQVRGLLATTLENMSGSLPSEGKSCLISLGQYLFGQVFSTELQTDFRTLIPQNSTFTLLIIADQEAWIPWELLYDGQRFLGDRFIIGRWLQELNNTRPYEFPVGAVNVAHYANVEQPQLWSTLLEAPGAPLPQPLPAGVLHDSTEAIRGLHLTRYSQSSDVANLRNAPVTLDNINDTEDIELQMRPAKLNLRRNRPFVTLSYVKTDAPELTALENTWASAFIRAGCSGFTGSLWAVEPAVEAAFISCFYNRLWAGASLSEAFYTSRQLARAAAPDSLDWLAYVLFGDPMARPYRPVPGDGYAIVEPIGREIDDPLPPGAIARFRVTLRRNPPVWHEDRVIEVAENLVFENLQVHIVTYGLQVIPDLPVTMTLTAKGDYLGWFTLVVPNEITETSALVQVYFADGMRPIHSLNFSLNIENGREE